MRDQRYESLLRYIALDMPSGMAWVQEQHIRLYQLRAELEEQRIELQQRRAELEEASYCLLPPPVNRD